MVGGIFQPAGAQIADQQAGHVIGHPGAGMNTVGDGVERQLLFRQFRPDILPHLAGNLAMQLADAVGVAGQLERQHRHAEGLLLVARVLAAQAEKLIPGQAERSVVSG